MSGAPELGEFVRVIEPGGGCVQCHRGEEVHAGVAVRQARHTTEAAGAQRMRTTARHARIRGGLLAAGGSGLLFGSPRVVQVLVKVHAAALNPVDHKMMKGYIAFAVGSVQTGRGWHRGMVAWCSSPAHVRMHAGAAAVHVPAAGPGL